ncbi:hypothetical protein F4556_006868 [Kitasatospora gansuensis]|uniref:Uncharacterized protein n=1 Tax=Kitasatospora gansuensis TaxID=258050 RepID=A0A7W7SIY4_9ACTN|nr:hypothetical protein [Kitasatospora gansuensis]MBB4951333.1 hypothetical protein [Kitasatospora gansuensis]
MSGGVLVDEHLRLAVDHGSPGLHWADVLTATEPRPAAEAALTLRRHPGCRVVAVPAPGGAVWAATPVGLITVTAQPAWQAGSLVHTWLVLGRPALLSVVLAERQSLTLRAESSTSLSVSRSTSGARTAR